MMQSKTTLYVRGFQDSVVKSVQPTIKTGRKGKVVEAIDQARE